MRQPRLAAPRVVKTALMRRLCSPISNISYRLGGRWSTTYLSTGLHIGIMKVIISLGTEIRPSRWICRQGELRSVSGPFIEC